MLKLCIGALVALLLAAIGWRVYDDHESAIRRDRVTRLTLWAGACPEAYRPPTSAQQAIIGGGVAANLPDPPTAWQVSQVMLYLDKGGTQPAIPCTVLLQIRDSL